MSDLIDSPGQGENAPEYSVSELSSVLKRMIEGEFSNVRIRGEVGRVSKPASGHLYFDLKDDKSVIASVTWRGQASKLATQPEEGLEVVATGKITTFAGQSRYQMIVSEMSVAGVGALMAQLEKRKKKLESEGLFDKALKKEIPYLPEVIGVITSSSGAVIRDILHRLSDRFPRKVLIWPVSVQGEKCAPEVTAAINGFNKLTPGGAMPRPDLLIVARGGGSIEDLWGFNEESVVRAVSESEIPLISAVGHETDTTLIDYASDLRAPTPTAAAEYAVPVRADLMGWLSSMDERRLRSLSSNLETKRQRLKDLSRGLPLPTELVAMQAQRLDSISDRLPRALSIVSNNKRSLLLQTSAGLRPQVLKLKLVERTELINRFVKNIKSNMKIKIQHHQSALEGLERIRQTLGYEATLRRGYTVVRDQDGKLVTSVKKAEIKKVLEIEFQDGKTSLYK
ncbi:exodeoxyribonuclease VII large subunit [Amylibacter sp.]|jgi:exodeoxyribonuclease VII large subunit|nr:exodeoxyribonuclease VII large subunit [Amylibacter sp.]MDB9754485.1 exodeoxyribonuclease VII large subunit [Amylibacter sp.]MDB9875209.1 exodeoxyribonuclease VII large subunit [Amylibacter sp.]MDB9992378.1 exodeoxyribonuclease VII large subunit [Amylibacter sp.]|tara:strand:+ start:4775 stop:6133 length:1359 start_codon:yes stop_codon:yes gene_type:complete